MNLHVYRLVGRSVGRYFANRQGSYNSNAPIRALVHVLFARGGNVKTHQNLQKVFKKVLVNF